MARFAVGTLASLVALLVWAGSVASSARESFADLPAEGAVVDAPRRDGLDRASRNAAAAGAATDAAADAAAADAGDPAGTVATGSLPFAALEGLTLVLPHPDPVLVAFHEATQAEALELAPIGRLVGNDNPTKFTPGRDLPGPAYRILSSRGRARPATSAVDVVLPPAALVNAPVAGRVVEVREYALYGRLRDWRIVIEPANRADLAVVVIHVEQPLVGVGDVVKAGETPLARVRHLPFPSHVDYATEQSLPHAHIEVKPAVEPAPLDPNAPALPAEEAAPDS